MKRIEHSYDIVVCGGGLAGFCAAVAAARGGARTALVHNRPVLGGNSSSEVGVTPHGAAAFHAYARETGIVSELLVRERSLNHAEIYENGWTNSVWDMVLYDLAVSTPNLTLHLNTSLVDVIMEGDDRARGVFEAADAAGLECGYYHRPPRNPPGARIAGVIAHVLNAEVEIRLRARTFIDCTGDGLVADRAGCEWRMGSESREEYGEPHAPERASTDTMGSSIHFRCRDVGRPVPFQAPAWAMHYDDASYFYEQGRIPKDPRGGFWWLEIGVPHHTIHDNEAIRHELTRHALGVWEWMKNRDPVMKERARNFALEWIGQVPGKRESRRIMGRYLMTELDVQAGTAFDDEIAFGGWFVDLHTPGGLLAPTSEPAAGAAQEYDTFDEYAVKSYCGPYGIPLRVCVARDVDNLMMAGRNISATHAALGTVRVMATTALLGQACGTAAAYGLAHDLPLASLCAGQAIRDVQQTLLRDGCFLPNLRDEDPANRARSARVTASSTGRVSGAGPDSGGAHEGMSIWRDQPQYGVERMVVRKGQLLALGEEGLHTISVCLGNDSRADQPVEARLHAVEHIWDYRVEAGAPLAATTLSVPPGDAHWIAWTVDVAPGGTLRAGQWLRIDLLPNEHLSWRVAGCVVPGHTGVYQVGANRYRRFANGSTLSFRVDPPQTVYAPGQVVSGVTRPHRDTNLWRSDPDQPLPQWVDLAWENEQEIREVQVTFPGHLLREYHAYAPHYLDPQTAREYRILVETRDGWKTVAHGRDNVQQRVRHTIPQPVRTARLRVEILATHGDPSAAIYEVRCY